MFPKEEVSTFSVSTDQIRIIHVHGKVRGPHKEGRLSSRERGCCQLLWTIFSGYFYKGQKINGATGPLPRSSYSWTHETLCHENECPGRSWGVAESLCTLITLNVVSCWDSQPRQPARLTPLRRGGVRIILEASNVLPFVVWKAHLGGVRIKHESCSCTWRREGVIHRFMAQVEEEAEIKTSARWDLNPECSAELQRLFCLFSIFFFPPEGAVL